MYRLGRYAVPVCLTVAVIALCGFGVRADVPQVPTGTWTPGGPFGDVPRDAASAVLAEGRLVVAGGSNSDGKPATQVVVYEPASATWTHAGDMIEARAGHTATTLLDGRVLITGGRTSNGVTASVEIYDPST